MAYAFNDDKSKRRIKELGIGDVYISGTSAAMTISGRSTKIIPFSSGTIKTGDVLGVLGIVILDTSSEVPGVTIGSFNIIDSDEYVSFEVAITNPTYGPIYLSNNCRIRVRTAV